MFPCRRSDCRRAVARVGASQALQSSAGRRQLHSVVGGLLGLAAPDLLVMRIGLRPTPFVLAVATLSPLLLVRTSPARTLRETGAVPSVSVLSSLLRQTSGCGPLAGASEVDPPVQAVPGFLGEDELQADQCGAERARVDSDFPGNVTSAGGDRPDEAHHDAGESSSKRDPARRRWIRFRLLHRLLCSHRIARALSISRSARVIRSFAAARTKSRCAAICSS